MLKNSGSFIQLRPILLGAFVALGLYASSLYSYLLFHSLVELFSVLVAFVIFVLAWNTRRILDSHYLLFIGIASLCSGALDLVHALAYKGMGVFPGYDANLATQLWIAFRAVFSVSLLLAPFFVSRKLHPEKTLAVSAAVTVFLLASIFLRWFPDCFVEGSGLTLFKIVSEYTICLIFLAALAALFIKRRAFDRAVLMLMALSILCSLISELSFTQYVSVYGAANLAGHFFELLSYIFIYRAIVVTGVVYPSNLLFRNLKQSEDALKESETRYRAIFENSVDAIGVSKGGIHVFVNPAYLSLYGYASNAELVGKPILDLIAPEEREKVLEYVRSREKGGVVQSVYETRGIKKDATEFVMDVHVSTYILSEETYTLVIIRDITESKRAEEVLRNSEDRYRSLFGNMLDGFAYCKMLFDNGQAHDFIYLDVNNAFEKLTGLKNVIGKKVTEVIPGIRESNPELFEIYGRVALTGKPERFELYLAPLHAWLSISVYSTEKGFFVVVFDNITARKQAEETLHKSHEELEGRVRERTAELVRANEELETEIAERMEAEGALRASSEEARVLYNNSRVTNDLLQLYTRKFSHKEYLDAAVVVIRDWSGCRHVGLRIADADGTIPFESCAGYDREFLDSESALSLERDHCACIRVIQGAPEPQDLPAMTSAGSFYSNNSIAFMEGLARDQATRFRGVCMQRGFTSLAVVPIRYREKILGAIHIADEQEGMVPLKNVEFLERMAFIIGEALFRFGVEGELRKLNRELEQRVTDRTTQLEDANRELEAFAYSVSHDLRAPLRAIDGFSRIIEEEHAEKIGAAGRDHFRRVRAAGQRMAQLIDAMLSLSRLTRGDLNRIRVDLGSLAKAAAHELKKGQPDRRVEFEIADGMTAEGDPVMLRIVVENLLGNAWKFTGKREAALIEFGAFERGMGNGESRTKDILLGSDSAIRLHPAVTSASDASVGRNPKSEIVYFVRDNGAGFDMTYAKKLFTAFQRLHTADEFPGLGIGLATVQRIIHRHGGRIWAEGEPDKGATFYFTLG
jgi:PAS domain S-box-containing protein